MRRRLLMPLLAALRAAWDTYGAGTNDDTSVEQRSGVVSLGVGGLTIEHVADCPAVSLGERR